MTHLGSIFYPVKAINSAVWQGFAKERWDLAVFRRPTVDPKELQNKGKTEKIIQCRGARLYARQNCFIMSKHYLWVITKFLCTTHCNWNHVGFTMSTFWVSSPALFELVQLRRSLLQISWETVLDGWKSSVLDNVWNVHSLYFIALDFTSSELSVRAREQVLHPIFLRKHRSLRKLYF